MTYGREVWGSGCCGIVEIRGELEFCRFEGATFGVEDIKEIAEAMLAWAEEKEGRQ